MKRLYLRVYPDAAPIQVEFVLFYPKRMKFKRFHQRMLRSFWEFGRWEMRTTKVLEDKE